MLQQNKIASDPFATLIANAIEQGRELSLELARQVDTVSPGHRFGFPKHIHMIALAGEADQFGRLEKLSRHDTALLKLLLSIHDIGRHQEALNKLSNTQDSRNHGELGAEIIINNGLLIALSQRDQQVILDAVKYHCTKEVPLSGRSQKFCYFLRDLDKLEILSGGFMQVGGAYDQIVLHYLSEEQRQSLRSDEQLQSVCIEIVDCGLKSKSCVEPCDPIAGIFYRAMNDRITPTQEALIAIKSSRQAELSNCSDNYGAYMLLHVAMIFDLHSTTARQRIQQDSLLDSRLEFLDRRLSKADSAEVRRCVAKFFEN